MANTSITITISGSPGVNAPENMSYMNAAFALWQGAASSDSEDLGPLVDIYDDPACTRLSERSISAERASHEPMTEQVIADHFKAIFQSRILTQTYLETMHGREIKVLFDDFPKLNITLYDGLYGDGHAAMVLQDYSKVPSSERLDKDDQHNFETDKTKV